MTRDATAATIAASVAPVARPFLLVELDFSSGTVYVNSTDRTITWGGHDYLGVGRLGRVDVGEETAELQANGISLQLSGVPNELVSVALDEDYQGRRCTIYIGFFDANWAVVADPSIEFEGRIDQMAIQLGQTAVVTLTAESRLADWETPKVRRYTDADQKAVYPEDRGLEFVDATATKEILWGRLSVNGAGVPGPAATPNPGEEPNVDASTGGGSGEGAGEGGGAGGDGQGP